MTLTQNSPIFLLGGQRSGTTALAYSLSNAFSDNNGIFTVNGKLLYYLNRWLTFEDLYHRHFRVDEIIYSLKRKLPGGRDIESWLTYTEKILNHFSKEVADGKHFDPYLLANSIMHECYQPFGMWGEKYNEYLIHFDYLNKILPEAKIILLYRNPITVAKSVEEWKGYRPWKPSNKENMIDKWTIWHERILSQVSELGNERLLVIEYDQMCNNQETEKLSNFVGIDLESYLINMKSQRESNYDINNLPKNTQNIIKQLETYKKIGVI